jgi:hypothetical protein
MTARKQEIWFYTEEVAAVSPKPGIVCTERLLNYTGTQNCRERSIYFLSVLAVSWLSAAPLPPTPQFISVVTLPNWHSCWRCDTLLADGKAVSLFFPCHTHTPRKPNLTLSASFSLVPSLLPCSLSLSLSLSYLSSLSVISFSISFFYVLSS